MDTIDLKAVLAAAIAANGDDRYFDIEDRLEGWTVAEETDWTQEGKYQECSTYVTHTDSGRSFPIFQNRSGSYHTDWYYSSPTVGHEVSKVHKVITTWVWERTK